MGCILIEVLFLNFLEEENIFLTLPENHRAGAGEHRGPGAHRPPAAEEAGAKVGAV